jgi:hypothetical protein
MENEWKCSSCYSVECGKKDKFIWEGKNICEACAHLSIVFAKMSSKIETPAAPVSLVPPKTK